MELLSKEELEKAFDNDRLLISARNRLLKYVMIISVLWIVLILFVLFKSEITGTIIWPYILVLVIGGALTGFILFIFRDSQKTKKRN